jgi:hypothetical protein
LEQHPSCMDPMASSQIFLSKQVDIQVLDDLHFLLKEYVRELEKKKKEIKKEIKDTPSTSDELKGKVSLIRKLQRNANQVLDDIEFHIRLTEDDDESLTLTEGSSE